MARVRDNHLGTISGKVGDLIFKRTKSGSFVYTNRRIRKKSSSEESLRNNDRFKLTNKFTAVVNSSVMLKETWSYYKNIKTARAYDKIHSYNSKFIEPDFITSHAKILPGGIFLGITGFSHDDNNAVFDIRVDKEFTEIYADPFSAVAVIYLNMPVSKRVGSKSLPLNSFIMVEQDFGNLNLDDKQTSKIIFDDYVGEFSEIIYYQRVRVFLSVFFRSKQDELKWTNNTSFLFKGHDIDNEYTQAMLEKSRRIKEEANNPKPQPKFRRIIKK